jgi:hypothetical protein
MAADQLADYGRDSAVLTGIVRLISAAILNVFRWGSRSLGVPRLGRSCRTARSEASDETWDAESTEAYPATSSTALLQRKLLENSNIGDAACCT